MSNWLKIMATLLGVFFVLSGTAHAYKPKTTHYGLASLIVDYYNFLHPEGALTDEEKQWVMQGSIDEDYAVRAINHMYDPVRDIAWNGENFGDQSPEKVMSFTSALVAPEDPVKAIEWVEDGWLQERYGRYGGDRTWQRALKYWAEGDREEALYTLGYVLHLIQDMGVPDHTRNDPHAFTGEFLHGDKGSPLEEYIGKYGPDNMEQRFGTVSYLKRNSVAPPKLNSVTDYLRDTALYSNKYFFSRDTIDDADVYYNGLPNVEIVRGTYGYGVDENGIEFPLVKIKKKWNDDVGQYEQKFDLLEKKDYHWILDAYFTRLSRKVVQNGAGTIELFFKQAEDARINGQYPAGVVGYKWPAWTRVFTDSFSLAGEIIKAVDTASSKLSGLSSFIAGTFSSGGGDDFKEADSVDLTDADENPSQAGTFAAINDGGDQNNSVQAISYCRFDTSDKPSNSPIVINEVAWMGSDNSAREEWFELKNITDSEVDISGYQIIDEKEQIQVSIAPGTTLEPGDYYLLERTDDNSSPVKSDQLFDGPISNSDEGLRLFKDGCELVDQVLADSSWPAGDNDSKQTMERTEGLSWQTSAEPGGTPGAKNSKQQQEEKELIELEEPERKRTVYTCNYDTGKTPSQNKLIINEVAWMGSTESYTNEWVEIKNISSETINISGYQLVDRGGDVRVKIPDNIGLPPAGFLLFERTDDNAVPGIKADIIYRGNISNSYEGLQFFDYNCNLLDEAIGVPSWEYGSNGTKATMERADDLSWHTSSLVNGTPRRSNTAPTPQSAESSSSGSPTPDNLLQQNNSTSNNTGSQNEEPQNVEPATEDDSSDAVDTTYSGNDVLISEVFFNADGSDDGKEFVEIYNRSTSTIDLASWKLKLDSDTLALFGSKNEDITEVPAKGYLLVGLSNFSNPNISADIVRSATLPNGFDPTTIILSSPGDDNIDEVGYGSNSINNAGESLERKSTGCLSPLSDGEFLGNGCDNDLNSDFVVQPNPNPQNSNSFPEPREKPQGGAPSMTYDGNNLTASFSWSPFTDFQGNSGEVTYNIKISGALILDKSSDISFTYDIKEVGKDYTFEFYAADKDGMPSAASTFTVSVSSFTDNIRFYKDPREGGTKYLVDMSYPKHPFVPDIYKNGVNDTWKLVVFYLNSDPVGQETISTDTGWTPDDTSNVLYVKYKDCAGSDAFEASVIYSDVSSRCSVTGGGLNSASYDYNMSSEDLYDLFETEVSVSEEAFSSSDYITAAYYSFYESGGGAQTFKLVAVDKSKHFFQANAPQTLSPAINEPLVTFDKDNSKIVVSWSKAKDPDTIDSSATYEINYGSGWESVGTQTSDEKIVSSGDSFTVSLRATDDFGNQSSIKSVSWEYPLAEYSVSQTQIDTWSDTWGYKQNSSYEHPRASFQTISFTENTSFNIVNLRVEQPMSEDYTTLRLSIFPSNGGAPDYANPISSAQISGLLNPDPNQDITFSFSNTISLSAGEKYWLMLEAIYSSSAGYYRNEWKSAVSTSQDRYSGGEAGIGGAEECQFLDNRFCENLNVPSPNGNADWYMKIGLE